MIKLKSAGEIEAIRASGKVLADTFSLLEKHIEPGVTTEDLDGIAREFIESSGGRPAFLGYQGFPASICASVNEVVIHGIPNAVPLKEGDILSLDIGVELDGYYSDSARTYPIGTVSEEVNELLHVTKNALMDAIAHSLIGNRISDISRAVYVPANEHEYGIVHQFCGHGVGFELHEDPQVPNYRSRGPNPRLKRGMVIAIEPMINSGTGDVVILDDEWTVVTADEKLSAHFEHTIAITEDGPQILTA